MEVVRRMMGTRLNKIKGPEVTPKANANLPATFDARTQWPKCAGQIGHIRDQANCGSCWAVSAAEVITDRTCIHGNGATDIEMSAEQIMSCCDQCGQGCGGGYPISAMQYWQQTGVVTGGDYGTKQGCLPYELVPCGAAGCSGPEDPTPQCVEKCESGYNKQFSADKHYASSHYYVTASDGMDVATAIQNEVYTNGPVEAAFNVYADFMNYKSGVYTHTTGDYLGGHAVKILGWGTQDNIPYWLVANSWNTTWGMNGFFLIKRGVDECGFEDGVVAGLSKN